MDEKTVMTGLGEQQKLQIQDSNQPHWQLGEANATVDGLHQISQQQNVDQVFWARILDFAKPKSRVNIGLFYQQSENKQLQLEVCRFSAALHKIDCAEGEAESSTTMESMIYQPIDPSTAADQSVFDQSAVGQLTHDALKKAFAGLSQ